MHAEIFENRSEAQKREAVLKKLTRKEKLTLLAQSGDIISP
jgi:predicted GIY-YIG superfamily endonuclease